jgi:hypothetical protein
VIRNATIHITVLIVFFVMVLPLAFAESFDGQANGNFHWKVYDYNASGQALRVRQPYFVQVEVGDGGLAFDFLYTPDTALFLTGHPSYRGDLLGDMTGKTISATVGITVTSGAPVFTYYGEGTDQNPCPGNANVRFFFQTRTSGPFNPSDYWWSNPVHADLQDLTLVDVQIENPFTAGLWTNYYGQTDPTGFEAAASNVVAIGLSFGGGCFFANGVGIEPGTGSAYFRLMDFSADPPGAVDLLAQVVPELVLAPFVVPTLIELP